MEISNNSLNNLINSTNANSQAAGLSGLASEANQGGLLYGLEVGSFVSGDIMDLVGNNVTISFQDGTGMNARLAGDLALNIGDKVILQVKENADNKLLLKAVSCYDSKDTLISTALKNANMPENTRNIAVVNELIKNGQPLIKQSIQKVLYGMQISPNSDIDDIVDLVKHNLDMTKDNLDSIANYKELNYSILKETQSFEQGISKVLSGANERNVQDIKAMISESIDVLTKEISAKAPGSIENNATLNPNNEALSAEENALNAESLNADGKAAQNTNANTLNSNYSFNAEKLLEAINKNISSADTTKLSELISKNASAEKILSEVNNLLKDENVLPDLFKSKEFINLFKNVIDSRWNLNAAKFNEGAEDKATLIKELYSKILHDTENLAKIFENNEATKFLSESLTNIKQNTNFVNQLNNIMSYVQLPIKFNEGKSHGDLYVYNNKKQKYVPGDLITAHLYLELEHLGATDVHISLKGNTTNTHFVLDDDLSMQIVEEHIPELIKKLEAKGYSCNYKVETLKESNESGEIVDNYHNPLKEILSKDTSVVNVKRYNFDVRA